MRSNNIQNIVSGYVNSFIGTPKIITSGNEVIVDIDEAGNIVNCHIYTTEDISRINRITLSVKSKNIDPSKIIEIANNIKEIHENE